MAKTTVTPSVDEQAPSVQGPEPLRFGDLVYTSRTLIVPPSNRALSVSEGVVEVAATDTEALSFLKGHAEFKPLKE